MISDSEERERVMDGLIVPKVKDFIFMLSYHRRKYVWRT